MYIQKDKLCENASEVSWQPPHKACTITG